MGLVNVGLNNVRLDNVNFYNDDLWLGVKDRNNARHIKKR